MKNFSPFFFLLFYFFISQTLTAQDVWLQNHFSPNSGCKLSSNETVTVLINNNSGVIMPSNTIQVYYTIDGGPITNQPLSSNLTPGASWNFSFSVKANLSVCGQHAVKVWVSRPGDVNPLNDTIVWIVKNDCTIVPGRIIGDTMVCSGRNDGSLELKGYQYGEIIGWEASEDSGKTWKAIANYNAVYNYQDVKNPNIFRVVLEGGYCPDAYSDTAGLTVEVLHPGRLVRADSISVANPGTLRLRGASHMILHWEKTDTLGNLWDTLQYTDTLLSLTGISKSSYFRVISSGNVCPATPSDTAYVFVSPVNGLTRVQYLNISVYPNPAIDVLFVDCEFNGKASCIIADLYGRSISGEHIVPGKNSIDIRNIPSGVYFVMIQKEGQIFSAGSFVKQ